MSSEAVFVNNLTRNQTPDPEENVFKTVWKEYERVIIESIITSFGLDFIKDQTGGDVDTIHNVRNLKDENGNSIYKNKQNQANYDNRGTYDSDAYHRDSKYIDINRKVSENKRAGKAVDAYTGKKLSRNADVDLDHVIAAKEIHDDPGRVLAEIKGTDLANTEENLKPTDRSINRSMQDKDIEVFLKKLEDERPQRRNRIKELKGRDKLTDKERKELNKLEKLEDINPDKMREENAAARKAYNTKINKEYYTSKKFAKDTAKAAESLGAKMGARQVFGFIFAEVWFAVKDELSTLPPGKDLKDIINAVGRGAKQGFANAKSKYKELISKFIEGFGSGVLSSLTTTICNIFFTTAKNLVKCIRQMYASVVQAGKVLLFNPDNLLFGDRIKTASVILATGASVLVGTAVGEFINESPIGKIPILGDIIATFCSALVSGILSCTLLVFLDRSKFINKLIAKLNNIATEVGNFIEIARLMEILAAKLEKLDVEHFEKETEQYNNLAEKLVLAKSENDINIILLSAYRDFNIKIPWKGDFDSFMGNKNNHLVFG